MANGKRASTRTVAEKAARTPTQAKVLTVAGGGVVIHGRGKPHRGVLKDLEPSVARAEQTATRLRQVIAARGTDRPAPARTGGHMQIEDAPAETSAAAG